MRPLSIGRRVAAVLVLVLLAAGCSTTKPAHPDELTAARADCEALASENQHLREALAKVQMSLLDREAQLSQVRESYESLQKKIDEAILEAVRAKAKLRSLESRAEAASTMAEAEIALKTIRSRTPEGQKDPELLQVERFLNMSAKEFEKENYGGALYLASQAKNLLTVAQAHPVSGEQLDPAAEEILFAAPLPLQITKTSNIREGPGLDFRALATLEKGTRVTGYSYKGQWVRVRCDDGLSGWVFYTLVSGQ
jgi:TolA-binding protein